jgi:hypothetical protein
MDKKHLSINLSLVIGNFFLSAFLLVKKPNGFTNRKCAKQILLAEIYQWNNSVGDWQWHLE